MSTTTKGESRSLDRPDEQVEKGGVHIDVVHLGDIKVKRAKYPAGWKFSKDMGADRCQDNHVGYGSAMSVAIFLIISLFVVIYVTFVRVTEE